jgi:hypothetical protein
MEGTHGPTGGAVPRRAAGRRMGSRVRSVSLVRSGGPATRSCLPATRGHRTLSERARKVDGGATGGECSLLELQRAVDGGATGVRGGPGI